MYYFIDDWEDLHDDVDFPQYKTSKGVVSLMLIADEY